MAENLDLDDLHDAILSKIDAAFPAVETVTDYDTGRKQITAPAILVELVDMEGDPDSNPGTEQLPVVTKWVARVVMSFRTPNVHRQVRKLAGALGVVVHQNRWDQPVNPAQVTVIGPDAFDPDLDRHEVWAVEWDQQVDLGQNVWTGEGVLPDRVMIGYAPDTGTSHEVDYIEIEGNGS